MTSSDTGFLSNTVRDVIAVIGLTLTVFQAFMAAFAPKASIYKSNQIQVHTPSFRERIKEGAVPTFVIWFGISELAHTILNFLIRSHLNSSIKSFDDLTNLLTWIFVFADGITFMVLFTESVDAFSENHQPYKNEEEEEEERHFRRWAFQINLICTVTATLGVLMSNGLFEHTGWAWKSFLIQLIGPWFVIAFLAALFNVESIAFLVERAWRQLKSRLTH